MKSRFTLKFLLLVFIWTSCVQDDDYEIPPVNLEDPVIDVNFSIRKVKEFYRGFEPVLIQAGPGSDTPLYLEGYVVSNDEAGNFFRTLVIQDLPENPTSAIAISTDASDVYALYEPGRKVYIRVDGLYSGAYAGLPTIGTRAIAGSQDVGRMAVAEFDERVVRTTTQVDLVPKEITIAQINEEYLNMLVRFNNVQFAQKELGASYANMTNTYGVNREVVNCNEELFLLRTSGYADFKNLALPSKNGTLTGVLGRFNTDFQLLIRDTTDVNFNKSRCD